MGGGSGPPEVERAGRGLADGLAEGLEDASTTQRTLRTARIRAPTSVAIGRTRRASSTMPIMSLSLAPRRRVAMRTAAQMT